MLNANRVVPRDRIVHELWNDSAPATVNAVLSTYASRLRRLLASDREIVLLTEAGGYMLRLPADRLDAHRFGELVAAGRRALAANDVARAAQADRDALSLWRGEPLADLGERQFARAEIARLEELHLTALEDQVEAGLALGRHVDVIGELEALIAEHPYRERLRGQLMLALYRSGRQAEALAAYRDARRVLAGDLGIEPGPELHELERKVLRQDPSLAAPRSLSLPAVLRPRRATATVAAVLALAVVLGAAAARPTTSATPLVLVGDSVAVVDAQSGVVVGEIPVHGRPGGIALGENALWVGNRDDRTLLRIDPRSRRITRTIGLPITPDFVTFGAGSVWVASRYEGRVVRIDPQLASPVATITLPRASGGCCIFDLEVGERYGWVSFGALPERGGLWRIDPRTSSLTGSSRLRVGALAVGMRAVWGLGGDSILRIDPATRGVVDAIQPRRLGRVDDCQDLATGDGGVWVANSEGRTVWKIDPSVDRLSRVFPLGHRPIGLAIGDGAAWVATADRTLFRIDERSGSAKKIPLGVYAAYQAIAVGNGAVWLSVTSI